MDLVHDLTISYGFQKSLISNSVSLYLDTVSLRSADKFILVSQCLSAPLPERIFCIWISLRTADNLFLYCILMSLCSIARKCLYRISLRSADKFISCILMSLCSIARTCFVRIWTSLRSADKNLFLYPDVSLLHYPIVSPRADLKIINS